MTGPLVERDERTTAVENAAYRWAYLFLSFGLLAIIAVRAFTNRERSWDLLALVVLGGAVNAVFQAFHRTLHRRWALRVAVTLVGGALLAAVLVLVRR
jgi:hypothetical protein